MKFPWIHNTSSKPDAMLTFSFMAIATVLAKVLLGGVTVALGTKTFAFTGIDASQIGALLAPTLGSYVARRYTDRKHPEAPSLGRVV